MMSIQMSFQTLATLDSGYTQMQPRVIVIDRHAAIGACHTTGVTPRVIGVARGQDVFAIGQIINTRLFYRLPKGVITPGT